MKTEKSIQPVNGYVMVAVEIILLAALVISAINQIVWLIIALAILAGFVAPGFFIVNPNSSKVLLLFGAYAGSVKQNGFFWMIPFYLKGDIAQGTEF
jgi:regulator of protease activity HflC (stomatin/prohibitin superfamily)